MHLANVPIEDTKFFTMFIENDELKTVVYAYQIEQITEADDDIILMAINAAIDEAKSYIKGNNKKDWKDGRPLYDANAVFSATGTNRNALLMEMVKNIAVWYVIRLCNVDMMFDHVKDRYDRAISWLKQLNKGEITLDLPLLPVTEIDETSNVQPFRFGSRTKFNHE